MKIAVCILALAFTITPCLGSDKPPACPPANNTAVKCEVGDYCINRAQMSGACTVQKIGASNLGAHFCGPYKSESAAIKAMCAAYEPASGDDSKCGDVLPSDVCKKQKGTQPSPKQ
jgi:hypothetical protein